MSGVVATTAGASLVGIVLLLAVAARPRPTRQVVLPSVAPPGRRPPAVAAAAVVVIVLAVPAALTVGVVPLGASVAAVALVAARRRRAVTIGRRRAIEQAMPDVVEMLVLCVHAGRSPRQAIGELAARAPPAVRSAFGAVELQLHRGRTLADALAALPQSLGPTAHELATAVASADRDGLPLAPVLDRLAAEARATRRRLGEAETRRLPVRLTFPLVCCTLPSFVLLTIAPAVLGALSTLRATAP